MKIQFFGAAGMVTGSCYLVTTPTTSLLIDCGMFQGDETVTKLNYVPLAFDPATLSGVVLTHAHLDHCGRLPLLVKGGYEKKLYMTEATKMLVELSLLDAAAVAQENITHPPLFTEANVHLLIPQIQSVPYDREFSIGDFSIVFHDAGHILGSASIEITNTASEKKETLVCSGDLGNTPQLLLQPTEGFKKADRVIMESTYGDKIHPLDDVMEVIQQEINKTEASQGVLLIPAFSIDRSQTILHIIKHLKLDGKIRESTPVFFDSPMAIKTTAIYEQFHDLFSDEVRSHTDDPFNFPGLAMTASPEESKKIKEVPGPKIIIAGNGMMSGGRIWHHLINYLPLPTTRLLIVGFQGDETVGKEILMGAKTVNIHGQATQVNAQVTDVQGLSAHADQPKLLHWLSTIKQVKKVYLVHGEDIARQTCAEKIKQELKINQVLLPTIGEEFPEE